MEEILSSIRRIIADDQDAAKQPSGGGAERNSYKDVLDLADLAEPDTSSSEDIDASDISFRDEPDPQAAPEPARTEPAMPEPARENVTPLPSLNVQPSPENDDAAKARLISPMAGATVNQAFSMLSHTVLSANARTLEDLVKEMLRPMLKDWLDANLPGMVERLVRAEIDRIAGGSR